MVKGVELSARLFVAESGEPCSGAGGSFGIEGYEIDDIEFLAAQAEDAHGGFEVEVLTIGFPGGESEEANLVAFAF